MSLQENLAAARYQFIVINAPLTDFEFIFDTKTSQRDEYCLLLPRSEKELQ